MVRHDGGAAQRHRGRGATLLQVESVAAFIHVIRSLEWILLRQKESWLQELSVFVEKEGRG